MKFLLSNSFYLRHYPGQQREPHVYPPLGPLYVAAYVRDKGPWDVRMFDATFAHDDSAFAAALQAYSPDIVGIQASIISRSAAKRMIQIARQSGVTVVAGGPDPTVSYADYLSWGANYVVLGEGEETMLELMHRLAQGDYSEAKTVAGIAYGDEMGIIVNPPRALISNLDQLPLPALDLIDIESYLDIWRRNYGYAELHLLTSRGCPFSCTWCSRAVFGRSFRQRSASCVADEVAHLRQTYGVDRFWIADDTFALNSTWLQQWHDEVTRRGLQTPFHCMTRAHLIKPELLQLLRETGCYQIHLGVESGSQRILDLMHKGTTVAQVRQASQLIRDAGIELGYFIMFGYPGEQAEDIHKTEQLVFDVRPDTLGISIAYPVPGTPFYESVKDRLDPQLDARWEQTGSDYQLLFRAEFSQTYYRQLIKYVQCRLARLRARRRVWEDLPSLAMLCCTYLSVRMTELVHTWVAPLYALHRRARTAFFPKQ